jgi:hypothetical protein
VPTQIPIILRKNRKRALGALLIIIFFVPISAWLVYMGLQPGRPDVSWALVLFGVLGVVSFTASGVAVIRTMRAPWRVELAPAGLALYTPAYDLELPWAQIAGIAVDVVNRRKQCALVLEDLSVVEGAHFHSRARRPDAVDSAQVMRSRMKANFQESGYHLIIPGRILETGAEELADLLTQARTGTLWTEA